MTELPTDSVAIVGMAIRFPGASSISQFWSNLCQGVESISHFPEDMLLAEGVPPELLKDPHYVKAGGVLEGMDLFDATLFSLSPTEAELMDPQQRLFLECAWESLENAGYCADGGRARVGVFGGVGVNRYLLFNFDREMLTSGSSLKTVTGNDKDYLTTRVSYKMGLMGPSICVQTACSTSLVAVHLACRSLLDYQTDLALAGAASLRLPQRSGYFYEEGGILSPDGHCRAFDASAAGTVFSSGVGVVVLKRLEEAVEAGDTIHAVIRGGAVNNDGAVKVGFTAPSIEAQAEVIAEAMGVADVDASTIGYVETHGTGTTLGDPIEIAALTKAFRGWTSGKQTCPIGSVKTNIGHLDTAAGVAGLIKTVLSLKHRQIPPSLHFKSPNPRIDFSTSPFYVNAAISAWKRNGKPRRAGVSSFGLGGTNCHLVVEEAPDLPRRIPSSGRRSFHVIPLSARNDAALRDATSALENYLSDETGAELGDIAFTYQVGRKTFPHRRVIVARSKTELASAVAGTAGSVFSSVEESVSRPVVFLFPGQGSHFVGMGQRLYKSEAVFRETIDNAAEILKDHLPRDFREVLFQASGAGDRNLTHTSVLQPALFAVEYALARMWQSWGVKPQAMLGHSLGEYVAACVAGVMSFEEGLGLVTKRGELIGRLPAGAMLSIQLREVDVQQLLSDRLSVAAVNAEDRVVVSGPADEISRLEQKLTADGIISQRLETSHAFHSGMMEPILEEFRAAAGSVNLRPPSIPYVSNLSGNWIEADEATEPDYWVRHLRFAVRFHDGLRTLLKDPELALLEAGPGRVLFSLANYSLKGAAWPRLFTSMPGPTEPTQQEEHLHRTVGQLWLAGVPIAWDEFQKGQGMGRIPLPTYPFQRERYWISAKEQQADGLGAQQQAGRGVELYVPSWQREPAPTESRPVMGTRLVIHDTTAAGSAIAARLRLLNPDTITACAGSEFREHDETTYTFDIQRPQDYDHLISSLSAGGRTPREIVHLLNLGSGQKPAAQNSLTESFYSLLWLLRAVGKYVPDDPVQVIVFSANAHPVHGREPLEPARALAAGPCAAASEEYPNITCRWVDTDITEADPASVEKMQLQLAQESDSIRVVSPVAYRRNQRFVRSFAGLLLQPDTERAAFRDNGVYLITGGFGGIGMAIARYLARESKARLILMSRTPLPDRAQWQMVLQQLPDADVIAQRIRKVLELEALGAQVLSAAADVADEAQMRAAVELAECEFGSIHGIVHAAGVAGGHMIQIMDDTIAEGVLAPKVKGAFVLAELFRTYPLDFFVLCSSLQSIMGGAGQSEYIAANAFLDAFAHWIQSRGTQPCMAINWDTWSDVGMATKAAVPSALVSVMQSALADGLSAETAVPVFARLAALPNPQVVVCSNNLHARLRNKSNHFTDIVASANGNGLEPKTAHLRPEIFTQYVPPSTPMEQAVAGVWQEVLGLDRVGIDDSIFELGGDSVSAIHVSQKLRERLGVSVPPVRIFTATTVRALVATLTPAPPAEADLAERQSRGVRRRAKRLSA